MAVRAPRAFALAQGTVSSTALDLDAFGFTAAEVAAADKAVISVINNPIMITWDGTTPTVTLGRIVSANDTVTVEGRVSVKRLKMVRQTGSDAEVTVHLEAWGGA